MSEKLTKSISNEAGRSLSQTKTDLRNLILTIKALEEKHKTLTGSINEISDTEWDKALSEINLQKSDVASTLSKYTDPENLKRLQILKKKKRQKRLRTKRRQVRLRLARKECLERRKKLHQNLDHWLESESRKQLQVKRDRVAADYAKAVLSNVTEKKTNARSYIRLLDSLKELRRLRRLASQHTDLDGDVAFNSKIDRLLAVWKDALDQYDTEENKLKSILSETHKSIEDRWLEVLFGSASAENERFMSQHGQSFEEFLETRRTWDSYAVPNDSEYGSRIPTGWVLPPDNPSAKWIVYRKS